MCGKIPYSTKTVIKAPDQDMLGACGRCYLGNILSPPAA
jgi:hypothetical protein